MFHRPDVSKLPYGYEILRILLECGGNINERTENGCRLAINSKKKIIINASTDVNAQSPALCRADSSGFRALPAGSRSYGADEGQERSHSSSLCHSERRILPGNVPRFAGKRRQYRRARCWWTHSAPPRRYWLQRFFLSFLIWIRIARSRSRTRSEAQTTPESVFHNRLLTNRNDWMPRLTWQITWLNLIGLIESAEQKRFGTIHRPVSDWARSRRQHRRFRRKNSALLRRSQQAQMCTRNSSHSHRKRSVSLHRFIEQMPHRTILSFAPFRSGMLCTQISLKIHQKTHRLHLSI